jgi:hypothetical protein
MVFFFKLDENNKNEWYADFLYALGDFSIQCQRVKNNCKEKATFILIYHKLNKIKKAQQVFVNGRKGNFEYYTNNAIRPDEIIGASNLNYRYSEVTQMEKDFLDKKFNQKTDELWIRIDEMINNNNFKLENIYIHITCKSNVKSILEHGLYAEKDIIQENRIGDNELENSINCDEEEDDDEDDEDEDDEDEDDEDEDDEDEDDEDEDDEDEDDEEEDDEEEEGEEEEKEEQEQKQVQELNTFEDLTDEEIIRMLDDYDFVQLKEEEEKYNDEKLSGKKRDNNEFPQENKSPRYHHKYLKYKFKYLQLKKKLIKS